MLACLARIDGWDPVAGAAVTLYATNVNDDRVCHLDAGSQGPWWPVLKAMPPLRYELVDAGFTGRIETPGSSLDLAIEPWPNFGRYALADARIRLWFGEPGAAFGSYTLRFDGRVTAQPAISEGLAGIGFAVDDRWLDTPLLALYAGTGGAEGPAALKGQPKPLAIGAPRYCPPVVVDSVNNVFQLSSYQIEGLETAFERLLAFEASVGDHASYAALVAATVPPGKWASAKAVGMVRHGAPPAGKLSYHAKGDKAGADGWVRLPGSVIKRLALIAGGSGKTHDASLTALNASRPYNISWHIRDQITARDAIQRIAASINAVMGVNWLGQMFVVPLPALSGSASVTLDSGGVSLPMVGKVEQLAIEPPFWRLAIETEVTEEVHRFPDEVAGSFVDRGAYVATESYREGHVVLNQSMAWLYIGAAPSTGNAPPTLPTTSNAWWRAIDPKLAGIAEGATRNVVYRQVPDPRGSNTINSGDIWIELVSPMRVWVDIGGTWQTAANYITSGSDIGVENGATKNVLYRQSTAPASPADNAFWVDTSVTPHVLKQRIAGAWQAAANLVTQGTDIGIANNAGSTVTLISTGGGVAVVGGNGVTNPTGTWGHYAYTVQAYTGGAVVGFRLATNGAQIVTLSPSLPTTPYGGNPPGYGWYVQGHGVAAAFWVAGAYVAGGPVLAAGDFLSIEYDETEVRWVRTTTVGTILVTTLVKTETTGVAPGVTYRAVAYINSGTIADLDLAPGNRALIDLSKGHLNKNQDFLPDGTTYARLLASEMTGNVHRLGIAGSGKRLGDLRNIPPVGVMNLGYRWPSPPTYTADSAGNATITLAAATVPIGSASVSYGLRTVGVTGTPGTTVAYQLYFDDLGFAGGSPTLFATTAGATVVSADGRVWPGGVAVTFPASGTTSGTGSSGGGGGTGNPPSGGGGGTVGNP